MSPHQNYRGHPNQSSRTPRNVMKTSKCHYGNSRYICLGHSRHACKTNTKPAPQLCKNPSTIFKLLHQAIENTHLNHSTPLHKQGYNYNTKTINAGCHQQCRMNGWWHKRFFSAAVRMGPCEQVRARATLTRGHMQHDTQRDDHKAKTA